MKRDINSIVILLATQSMINLGEIKDPVTNEININLNNAKLFIDLLQELKAKTKGNLSDKESDFINEILNNLTEIYNNKNIKEKQK